MQHPRQSHLVSILIRSTGRAELVAALDSVAKQTYDAIEVLVADAAGTGSVSMPADFRFSLRVIGNGFKLRRSQAANLLLAEAGGGFALFLDDDDWIAPTHVSRLIEELKGNPAAILAYAGVSCVECPAGPLMPEPKDCLEVRCYDEPFNPIRLLVENYLPIHAVLFRTEALSVTPSPQFDPSFDLFEDWDFWLQFLALGDFLHVPGISAYYRIHSDAGAGVRYDKAAEAEAALDQLISKWRIRWTPQQIRQLFGYTRHVNLLGAALQDSDKRVAELQQHAVELQQMLKQQLQQHTVELQQRSVELERQRISFENSHSWRITAPLRRLRRFMSAQREHPIILPIWQVLLQNTQNFLARLYHSPKLQPLARFILFFRKRMGMKRNWLPLASHERALVPDGDRTAHYLERSLGGTPRVTIVIPVFNHSEYIEQSIRSALAQTWRNLEVVVVDDASPDPNVRCILERLEGEPRLTILRNENNQGICAAQNRALIHSTGDIIAFLDCDDYLTDDAIAICIRQWRDDTVYLHSGRINVDESGQEINRIHFQSLPRQDYFAENLQAMYATHLKMIRRDAFVKVGLFDPRFDSAQDYEMLMRIAFHYPSLSFVHVPDFVYHHRLHAQQTTETRKQEQDRLTRRIQDEARLRLAIRNGEYRHFLSFIMLSYGKHSQTLKAIQGLKNTVSVPHEIILYDNGSTAETVEFLKTNIEGRFDGVRVFYGERNLGPAKGRRVALGHATGEWFIIFDNDEIPEPGWLEELLLRAEANENVGAVCCRVAFPDEKLQFSGGKVTDLGDGIIDLGLYDRGFHYDDLQTCEFRTLDWCPIGATLFTINIAPYLHEGYPNTFEDAGVSFALRKEGKLLLNAPGALVWHDHITFQPKAEMRKKYMADRYNPALMLKSVASFYRENGLIIHDEYIWRENRLNGLSHQQLLERLESVAKAPVGFG
jgi:glycosyltransferase involved in cell wall biosynthesis